MKRKRYRVGNLGRIRSGVRSLRAVVLGREDAAADPVSRVVWRLSALVVIGVGAVVLAGWVAGVGLVDAWLPGTTSMKANTAACFILMGAGLLLLGPVEITRRRLAAGLACVTVVAVVALASLGEWLFSWDLHIDQLLASEPAGAVGTSEPGRMAATTALSFCLAAFALALLRLRDPRFGQALVIAGSSVIVAVISAEVFDIGTLRGTTEYTHMAIPAAVAFIALWIGFFALRADGLSTAVSSRTSAGAAARVLLPAAIVVPILLGWLSLRGEDLDLYGSASGLALLTTANAVVFAGVVWATTRWVYRSEVAVSAAEQALTELVAASPDAILALSHDGTLLGWNAAAERLFGYTAEEAAKQDPLFLVPEELREQTRRELDALAGGGPPRTSETVRLTKDGRRIPVAISGFQLRGSGGNATVFRDIAERKRSEEALRASEARYRSLFQSMQEGFAYCDVLFDADLQPVDFRFSAVNHAFLRLTGFQEVEGRRLTEVFPAIREQSPGVFEAFGRVASTGRSERFETYSTHSDQWLSVSAYSIESGGIVALFDDITERKASEQAFRDQAQRALREAREQLQALMDYSPAAIFVKDLNGRNVVVNRRYAELMGGPATEYIGRTSYELFPREEADANRQRELDIIESATAAEWEETVPLPGGPRRFIANGFPLLGSDGKVEYVGYIYLDITERKRLEEEYRVAEEALRASQERFVALFRASSVAFAIVDDATDEFTELNAAFEFITGFGREDAIGRTVEALEMWANPAERAEMSSILQREGRVADFEATFRRNSGELYDGLISVELLDTHEGRLRIVVVSDITALKRLEKEQANAEQALRASQEQFAALFRASPGPVVILDDTTEEVVEVNEAFESATGFRREEVVGQTFGALELWANPAERDEVLSVLQREGRVAQFEARMRMKSGELYDGLASVEVVNTPRRRLRIIATIDISARKRAEAALIGAMATADRANRAKSEFLSRMSHELRTPLNVILGFAQVLQLDPLDPNQDEAVGHILGAGRHLLDLINDVLDLSRMESGRTTFSIEPVSVAEAIEDSLGLIQPLAADRHIATRFIPDEAARGLLAMSDRQRLKQVLLNLLSNAVKYNRDGGSVTVTCALTGTGEVRIQVADTGPGIDPEKLDLLFQPFERLGAEATTVEGTGLGLALSKRFVEAMGGTIGASATVGEGAVFWLDLPPAGSQQPAESTEIATAPQIPPAPSLRPATVLYIEDSLANLKLVERLLARFRTVDLMPAAQGRIGIDLARMHRPDLVLLDLHLPDISGEVVLRALKADPATQRTPVIIVSADATPGQVARLKQAGAFAYVTKPLDVREFVAVIERALGDRPADGEG